MLPSTGVISSRVIKGRRFQSSLLISEAMTSTAIRTMLRTWEASSVNWTGG